MTELNDTKKRLIMMLTIIIAGSAITFIDLSPVVVILIALITGIVMLLALKMITIEEIKELPSNLIKSLNQPITFKSGKKGEEKYSPAEKQETPKEKTSDEKAKKREIPFASLIEKLPLLNKNKKEKKADKSDAEKKPEPADSKKSLFSGLPGIGGLFSRKKSVEEKTKQIDSLLEKTIKGEFPDSEEIKLDENSPLAENASDDNDFSDFDDMDLGLEEEETSDISKSDSMPGFEEEIPDSAIADILAKEGIELELDDESFPSPSSENVDDNYETTSSSSGMHEIDELDGDISGMDLDDDMPDNFDEIDLDEIETEDEIDLGDEESIEEIEIGDSGEEIPEPSVAPVMEDEILSAPPKEWSQTKSSSPAVSDDNMFETPMSLSLGGGGDDDDLFAMLKSDTKKAVSVQEASLVRDLKDANIESEELVEDLESILEEFGIEREPKDNYADATDEEDINN